MTREELEKIVFACALEMARHAFEGPADEARDDHGRWTDGGGADSEDEKSSIREANEGIRKSGEIHDKIKAKEKERIALIDSMNKKGADTKAISEKIKQNVEDQKNLHKQYIDHIVSSTRNRTDLNGQRPPKPPGK